MLIIISETALKYFSIIVVMFYTYNKLLNRKNIKRIEFYKSCIFIIALTSVVVFLRSQMQYISVPIMIFISYILVTLITKVKVEVSVLTVTISFGISYVTHTLSATVISVIYVLLGLDYGNNLILPLAYMLILQFCMIILLFKIKRLKKGMPFLYIKGSSSIAVIFSAIVLSCIIMLNSNNVYKDIYVFPLIQILFSAVFIFLWWKSKISRTYLENLKSAEIQALQRAIQCKDEEIAHLKEHNETLSKIIHKDNKLIPAMQVSVKEFLSATEDTKGESFKQRGEELLAYIDEISGERGKAVNNYQGYTKKYQCADIYFVDGLLEYMGNIARESDINFDVTITGDIKYMIDHVVTDMELATLLADLVENAIIATKKSRTKNILVNVGLGNKCYNIDIIDSGIPFEIDTIANLGLKKITTRENEGGSGIGLSTAFEIVKRHGASFILEEFSSENSIYTKKLSIKFDLGNQFAVKTFRADKIRIATDRDDLTLITTPA